MSILKPSDFNGGEQAIADLSNEGARQNLQAFIDEYEIVFLRELLGLSLANEFYAAINITDPAPDQKWIDLRDTTDIKPMLKCYVYYWFIRNKITLTTGTGEVKAKNENSTITFSGDKLVRAWNKMSNKARLFDISTVDYPTYVRPYWGRFYRWYNGCGISEIYYPINTMNI